MKKHTLAQKERLIGLDILRILSMVLITLRHFIGYSGLIGLSNAFSVNGMLIRVLDVLCGSAVNIFVLISGYFLVDSKLKWNRVLKIWGETFFYSVVCFALSAFLGAEKITAGKLLLSAAPLLTRHYWFTVAYLAMYVISPFLNKLIHILEQKEYRILVLGGALLLSAWTSFIYFSQGVLTGGNTSLIWFIYLYFVGGYLKKYPQDVPSVKVCALGVLLLTGILLAYSIMSERIGFLANFPLLEDDSILELALSVSLFGVFLRITSGSSGCNRVIGAIAGCSFGVYLIQESCMLRQWLWHQFVKPETMVNAWYLLPVGIAVVAGLFVLAFVGHKLFEVIFSALEKIFKNIKLKK